MMREDWSTEKLGSFVIYEKGKKPANQQSEPDETFKYPYVDIEAFEKGIINNYTDGEKCKFCSEDDILMVWDGSRFGLVGNGIKGALGSTLMRINFPGINNDYAFYFLKSKSKAINTRPKGTGTPHVDPNLLWNYDFPIAPLPEQRAIVTKIEQLFSELDNGIANLKDAKEKLEIYRQAVLKKAFEGELTKEWREKQEDSDLSFVYLKEIADVATGATPKKSNSAYWIEGTVPWVTSGTLNDLYVNEASDLITEKALKETNCKIFPKGSLLIAMYGEGKTRGKCSELMIDAATNQAIAAVLLKSEFNESKKYLKWFFIKNYNDIRLLSSGGVQPNLNLTKIKETRIPFPTIQEQTKIVNEIETRLSVCDSISANIEFELNKAELLRQSILKKAFEGKLLTEEELKACKKEPDWDPAEKLLERIKQERNEEVKI